MTAGQLLRRPITLSGARIRGFDRCATFPSLSTGVGGSGLSLVTALNAEAQDYAIRKDELFRGGDPLSTLPPSCMAHMAQKDWVDLPDFTQALKVAVDLWADEIQATKIERLAARPDPLQRPIESSDRPPLRDRIIEALGKRFAAYGHFPSQDHWGRGSPPSHRKFRRKWKERRQLVYPTRRCLPVSARPR